MTDRLQQSSFSKTIDENCREEYVYFSVARRGFLLADNKIYRQFIKKEFNFAHMFLLSLQQMLFWVFFVYTTSRDFFGMWMAKGNCRNQNSSASGHRTKISRAWETDQSHQASLCFFPLIQKKILELRKYTNFYFLNAFFKTFSPYHSCFTVIDCNLSIMINGCV